jgi:hypothetical protein
MKHEMNENEIKLEVKTGFFGRSAVLYIDDEKIRLKTSKKDCEIYFKNIRSFLVKGGFFGHKIYIYEETEILPFLEFYIVSSQKVFGLQEVLKYRIEKVLEKEKELSNNKEQL